MLQSAGTPPRRRDGYVWIRQVKYENSSFTKVMKWFATLGISTLINHGYLNFHSLYEQKNAQRVFSILQQPECAVCENKSVPMPILRSFLIALSRNSSLRHFAENSTLGGRMSSRFVAGTSVEEVLEAAASVNRQGISTTLDSLGENVHSPQEAQQAAEVYHRLLDAIQQRQLDANVSVKLTQMGMDLDPELAFAMAAGLVEHAVAANTFVRIDMEGSDYTQATIDMVCKLHALDVNRGHVGVVIQAYLYRSKADIDRLLAEGIRIRLCKGAYQEPARPGVSREGGCGQKFYQADADPAAQWDLPRHRHPR